MCGVWCVECGDVWLILYNMRPVTHYEIVTMYVWYFLENYFFLNYLYVALYYCNVAQSISTR